MRPWRPTWSPSRLAVAHRFHHFRGANEYLTLAADRENLKLAETPLKASGHLRSVKRRNDSASRPNWTFNGRNRKWMPPRRHRPLHPTGGARCECLNLPDGPLRRPANAGNGVGKYHSPQRNSPGLPSEVLCAGRIFFSGASAQSSQRRLGAARAAFFPAHLADGAIGTPAAICPDSSRQARERGATRRRL